MKQCSQCNEPSPDSYRICSTCGSKMFRTLVISDDVIQDPAAYLHMLQGIEREQELAKLNILVSEFKAALGFFIGLQKELQAFNTAKGIQFEGLADRLRLLLQQAEDLREKISHLSGELRHTPEMNSFVEDAQKKTGVQTVGQALSSFDQTCENIRARLDHEDAERKRLEAERLAEEERRREAQIALLQLPFKLIWLVVVGLFKVISFLFKLIFSKK